MNDNHRPPLVRRLESGQDFRTALQNLAREHNVSAGVILSAVGSFSSANLRLAGAQAAMELNGPLEIVSATGTLGIAGLHVHLSVADRYGTVYGGHLLVGCIVASTVELVIADFSCYFSFDRAYDPKTGYQELKPKLSAEPA